MRTTDRPLASAGLVSYRYPTPFGFVMIGARDADDALREAARSTTGKIDPHLLERWNGSAYEPNRSA